MCLRIFSSAALLAILAACGSDAEAPDGPTVECAIGPGSDFSAVCSFERLSGGEFVIHHPDGGFRRFALTDDAAAPVGVADGAEPLKFSSSGADGKLIEVELATDRYRLDPDMIALSPDE